MELRPDFNKKDLTRNPSFNRHRLAYRAPIRSINVNLEDHQISYEMANLHAILESVRLRFEANGTEFENLLDSNDYILGKINNLYQRLMILEGN